MPKMFAQYIWGMIFHLLLRGINMKHLNSVLVSMLLISFCLAGCIENEDSINEVQQDQILSDFVVPDPDVYQCFEFEGWDRCWLTYFPENVNLSSKSPVIFELHGWAASSFEMRNYTSITSLADEVGAIVIHPEGLAIPNSGAFGENQESWNSGVCCGDAKAQDINDSGFLIKLINNITQEYPVDENRIYFTGWSNGCQMSQRMALEASHLIAAVACTSGYLGFTDDSQYSPIPIMEMHGVLDEIAQYTNSGRLTFFEEDARTIEAIQNGAVENLYDWAAFNNCDGPIADSNDPNAVYSIQRFTSCENNTEVALFTSYSGGHNLYVNDICDDISYDFVWSCLGNQGLYDTHGIMWDFMSRYSKESGDETE